MAKKGEEEKEDERRLGCGNYEKHKMPESYFGFVSFR